MKPLVVREKLFQQVMFGMRGPMEIGALNRAKLKCKQSKVTMKSVFLKSLEEWVKGNQDNQDSQPF